MSTRMLVSLGRLGAQTQVTYAEYDNHRKLMYRITYPITYTEACDLGAWATLRATMKQGDCYLTANGWDLWLPIHSVISPDVKFHPLHSGNRKETIPVQELYGLAWGHYSVLYN